MGEVEELGIAVTAELAAELRAAVDGGEYGSINEAVGDALRDWRLRRRAEALETEELRRLVQEGMESGPAVEAAPVFARLRARYAPSAKG